MRSPPRRSAFAYAVSLRGVARHNQRASVVRVGALVGLVGCMLASGAPWWAWLIVAVPIIGTGHALQMANYVIRDTMPSDRPIAWAWRSATLSHGKQRANVSGVLEVLGGLAAITIGPWALHQETARLGALVVATIYTSSTFFAVCRDPAFFNPDEQTTPWLEVARAAAGPTLCALALLASLPAGWPPGHPYLVALICGTACLVTVRTRDLDRSCVDAAQESVHSELAGRDLVLAQVHTSLSTSLGALELQLARNRSYVPEAYDAVSLSRMKLQQLMTLEDPQVTDGQQPDTLSRPVEWIARAWGVHSYTHISVTALSALDHDLVRLVLSDLVTNACRASATRVWVSVGAGERGLEVKVKDDAAPFPPGAWRAPRSSLDRLGRILEERGGHLSLDSEGPEKEIIAVWTFLSGSEDRR